MMESKPGIYTTEFWSTTGLNIILMAMAFMVQAGWLAPSIGEKWEPLIRQAVTIGCLIAVSLNQTSYNKSRAEVKIAEKKTGTDMVHVDMGDKQ